jgi:hypothetical protein
MPSNDVNATGSVEIDSRYLAVSNFGRRELQPAACRPTRAGQAGPIPQLQGFDNPEVLYQTINANRTCIPKGNSLGGVCSLQLT